MKMWISFSSTFFVILVICGTNSATGVIKGPPTAEKKELTKVARLGQDIRLNCPLSGFPVPIVSWTKDKESINNYAWVRFKATKKSLKIKEVAKEDTGIYVCKGTNGFGSEEIRIDLIVIDPEEFPNLGEDELPDVAPPVFTEETLEIRPSITRETGENFRLTCEALGKPEPEVTWFRNRREFLPDKTDVSGLTYVRKGKAVLVIKNLIQADSGTFTCQAKNMVSTVTRNFTLHVEESTNHPILPSGPENTTVEQGDPAILECRVQSTTKPTIKWLKKLESWEMMEEQQQQLEESNTNSLGGEQNNNNKDIFDLGQDNKFRVISSANNFEDLLVDNNNNGKQNEYLNKLMIPEASEADAGMYYCFVTNTIGYKYKNAYLTVIPNQRVSPPKNSSSSVLGSDPIMITVICLAVFVLVLLVFITICVVRKKHKSKRPTAETPDVQENLMRQHHLQQQQQQVKQMPTMQPGPPLEAHPHQIIYQQQQYQATNMNNNHRGKIVEQQQTLPPPPPPPSLHNETNGTSTWGMYPPIINAESVVSSSYKPGSVYSQQSNQYEVPHVPHLNRKGMGSVGSGASSSRYYGSQKQQQPVIYPGYMGQQQQQQQYNY